MSVIEQYLSQAESLFQSKNYSSARMYARKVVKRDPNNVSALTMLGLIYLQQQQLQEAESHLKAAQALVPTSVNVLAGLVRISEVKEDHFAALQLLQQLCELEPTSHQYRYKLAMIATKVGNMALAEQCFDWCVSNNMPEPAVMLNLGHIHKAKSNTDVAADFYKKYISLSGNQYGVGYWSLADLKRYQFSADDISELERCAGDTQLSASNHSLIQFALCKAYEQHEQVDKACQAMLKANELMSSQRPFKQALFSNLVFSLLKHLPSAQIDQQAVHSQTPIFIVGMPRSGTTLVEQILACHTQVGATDELPFMERFALQLEMSGGYQARLNNLTATEMNAFKVKYLAEVNHYFDDAPVYVIDKNPNNFLHIGLIKSLFPQAKIINVVRNTVDNGLSVFKQYFSHGHDYSYSLDGISTYWGHYLDIMAHWDTLYPNDILHVCFEQLVNQPQAQIQRMLDYCGLETQAQCFTFYESKRAVLTPSASQVRQPMNPKAIGQSDKYRDYLPAEIAKLDAIAQKAAQQFFG